MVEEEQARSDVRIAKHVDICICLLTAETRRCNSGIAESQRQGESISQYTTDRGKREDAEIYAWHECIFDFKAISKL